MVGPSTQPEEAYPDWLATHVFSRADAELYERRIATWPEAPHFQAVLLQDGADNDALARSLNSLAKQYYPRLKVSVIADVPAPAGIVEKQLHWQEVAGGEGRQRANRVLYAANADWFCLLRAGDQIAPHAFLLAAEAIHAHPEWEAIYSDEDRIDNTGRRTQPSFKPDFDIELLRATGYLGGLLLLSRRAASQFGGWPDLPRGQDELAASLRLAEICRDEQIGHIADVLLHRDAVAPVVTEVEARRRLVQGHLDRLGIAADVRPGLRPEALDLHYACRSQPRVSILIPTKDHAQLLERCITTLFEQTDYPDFEVIIIDNGSTEPAAVAYLDGLQAMNVPQIRVLRYAAPFNFSAMNNLAAAVASGDYLLLLNNDTAAVHRDWLARMVALLQQENVGAVGARLLHPDGSVQHAGVVLGMAGPAEHPFFGWPADATSPMNMLHVSHRVSAVTAACLLMPRPLYLEIGGMDEQRFTVSYNDVDLCLNIGAIGRRILWTPYATLLHEGSATQGRGNTGKPPPDKLARFQAEQEAIYTKWMKALIVDRSFNRNLSLSSRDYTVEAEPVLSWRPTPWRPLSRVLAYPADFSGSGEIRLLSPRRVLDSNLRLRGYASMRQFTPVEIAQSDIDTLVMQRPIQTARLELLRTWKRYSNARCLVDIDDLITVIPPQSPHYRDFDKKALECFYESIKISDGLLVSTPPLAESFAHLNEQITIVQNYLERARWLGNTVKQMPSNRPRVGWAGSVSHVGDLAVIRQVIEVLASEVDWIFMGLCPPKIRKYVREVRPAVGTADYPSALASLGLDLAIAPLEINAFNEAKSNLKLLEYGILGYPVICTDILPYQGEIPVTRVINKPEQWIKAIREHINDLDESRRRGQALREHVLAHWMLEDHLDEWLKAWLP